MFLTRLKVKQRFSVLMLAMLLFSFGLTAMSAPTANAACPVQNCHPEPDPNEPLPVPPVGNVIFHVNDQFPSSYRIISLKMTYYSVSNNQYVQYSRTAYSTNVTNPTSTNYFQALSNYGMFKSVRVVTDKPTTFTAYGQYANGSYGYKTAVIQYTTTEKLYYCKKWAIGSYPNMQAQGFYPNYNCP